MDIKELRIGNYVKDMDYDYVTIAGIHPESTNELTVCINDCDVGDRLFKDVEGIPLTEEWLLKFGFEYLSKERGGLIVFADWNKDYKSYLHVDIKNKRMYLMDFKTKHFNGMNPSTAICLMCSKTPLMAHQLQNLFFALTGKELTIKETA